MLLWSYFEHADHLFVKARAMLVRGWETEFRFEPIDPTTSQDLELEELNFRREEPWIDFYKTDDFDLDRASDPPPWTRLWDRKLESPDAIELTPTATETDMASALLRRVKLGALYSQMEREFRDPLWSQVVPALGDHRVRVPRPGRRGRSDWELAQWVEKYELAAEKDPRRPTQTLANSEEGYSVARVRDILRLARQKGLMTPAQRGKPGGGLTEAGRRALRDQPQA